MAARVCCDTQTTKAGHKRWGWGGGGLRQRRLERNGRGGGADSGPR